MLKTKFKAVILWQVVYNDHNNISLPSCSSCNVTLSFFCLSVGSLSPHHEPCWIFVIVSVTENSRSDSVWLPRLDNKSVMHFCLCFENTCSRSSVTILPRGPSNYLQRLAEPQPRSQMTASIDPQAREWPSLPKLPASSHQVTLELRAVPAEAPVTMRHRQGIPTQPFPSFWSTKFMNNIKWLSF